MTDFMAAPKRAPQAHMEPNRRALALIRPFASRFDEWNRRAAHASASALSSLSSGADKAEQAKKLAALYGEVKAAHDEFETAVAGEPEHGRIDDMRAAFSRLLSVLSQWRDG